MVRVRIIGPSDVVVAPSEIAAYGDVVSGLLNHLESYRILRDAQENDYEECRDAAQRMRSVLGMNKAAVQGVTQKMIREAEGVCEDFVRAAGRNGKHFEDDPDFFEVSLTAFRRAMGVTIARLSFNFGSDVDRRLAEYFPHSVEWQEI